MKDNDVPWSVIIALVGLAGCVILAGLRISALASRVAALEAQAAEPVRIGIADLMDLNPGGER